MSTLSHYAQPVARHSRISLVVLGALTALVITIVLIASRGTTSADPFSNVGQPSTTQTPQEQLQAVSGARYGLNQGISQPVESPQQQLQAVAGARYHVTARATR